MTQLKPRKIAIIGCGNVGTRYVYASIIRGIAREMILVDLDKKRLEGEVMDLCHTAPYTQPVEIRAGDYPDIKNSDLVVITAGTKQKPGQSRIALVKDNVEIFKKIIPKIMRYAPESIMLIVSNPVDILAYAAYKISGKPHKKVLASGTVLDTARFRFLLADHCDVDPRNVHAYILGEHGDTEFPVWSRAMIGGMLFEEYCLTCHKYEECNKDEARNEMFNEVKESAYEIIDRKGETSYGIGLALVRISQAILDDQNAVLPVSSLVDGYLGVKDVYLSRPSIVNKSGIRQVLNIELSDKEKEDFKHSANSLKKIIKDIRL
jgi:L-lactate dehydrogenase